MAILFEGDCNGKAVDVEIGVDNQGKPRVRWKMLVVDGPHKDKKADYSGKLDADNIKWTKRDMKAIGWQGADVRTFVEDVKKADRVVPFTAEIAENAKGDKVSRWTSAKLSGALPLQKLAEDKVADVNSWFAEADDVAPAQDDSLPF